MRRTRRLPAILTAVVALSTSVAIADGLRFENGRLNEGVVTVLDLSEAQLLQVRTKRTVVLTDSQKRVLRKAAGISPTVLTVYSTKMAAAGIDSCFEYNVALWFEPTRIEVPHRFLVSDEDAVKKADDFDSIE